MTGVGMVEEEAIAKERALLASHQFYVMAQLHDNCVLDPHFSYHHTLGCCGKYNTLGRGMGKVFFLLGLVEGEGHNVMWNVSTILCCPSPRSGLT